VSCCACYRAQFYATVAVVVRISPPPVRAKVFPEFLSRKTLENGRADYGVDDGDDDVLIVVFVSVFSVVAGDGFTTVVFVSFFS